MIAALGLALAILFSALFSGLETGLYTTSRLRLYLDARAGVRPAEHARRLLSDLPALMTVLLVANNLANWAASYLAQVALRSWEVASPALVGTALVSAVLFVLGESVPKSAFRRSREVLLYRALPILVGAHRLLRVPTIPITAVARRLAGIVERRIQGPGGPAAEGEVLVRAGADEGFLTPFQERVARGVLALRSTTAEQEALALEHFPTVRLGRAGVTLPERVRDQRVLVLDPAGERVLGWVPLALLREDGGFRAARRAELRPVAQVEASTSLDRVFATLDRSGVPFAVVAAGDGLAVLDTTRMRLRIMGTRL